MEHPIGIRALVAHAISNPNRPLWKQSRGPVEVPVLGNVGRATATIAPVSAGARDEVQGPRRHGGEARSQTQPPRYSFSFRSYVERKGTTRSPRKSDVSWRFFSTSAMLEGWIGDLKVPTFSM